MLGSRVKDLGRKLRMEITVFLVPEGLLELVHKENKARWKFNILKALATSCEFFELEHLMYWCILKNLCIHLGLFTVSGPPPAALGPPVPRNQRLLGRTPSPARPVPEGPEKPEPRAGGASVWTKVENGEVSSFPKPSNSLALEIVWILGIFYPALKQISLENSLQFSGDNDLLGVYRNIFEEIISLDHQYGATLRKVRVTLWGISGWWVDG